MGSRAEPARRQALAAAPDLESGVNVEHPVPRPHPPMTFQLLDEGAEVQIGHPVNWMYPAELDEPPFETCVLRYPALQVPPGVVGPLTAGTTSKATGSSRVAVTRVSGSSSVPRSSMVMGRR